MMDLPIWKKICDELAGYPWSILNLGTDGEPLLHPHVLEMLRYAKRKNIYPVNVTTNGTLLDAPLAEVIVKEGLIDLINISLDALNAETYRKIRAGDHQKVYGHVERLVELRNRWNPKIKIQVNIIDQPEVRGEIDAFVAYWGPKVDNVLVRTYYDATVSTGATGGNISGKQQEFEKIPRWPCQQFWRRFNVGDDGTARFCVDDWYNKSVLGDLRTASIAGIWSSPRYEELRAWQTAGDFAKIPYCAKCTEWQGMKWEYDYFTAMEKVLGKRLL